MALKDGSKECLGVGPKEFFEVRPEEFSKKMAPRKDSRKGPRLMTPWNGYGEGSKENSEAATKKIPKHFSELLKNKLVKPFRGWK